MAPGSRWTSLCLLIWHRIPTTETLAETMFCSIPQIVRRCGDDLPQRGSCVVRQQERPARAKDGMGGARRRYVSSPREGQLRRHEGYQEMAVSGLEQTMTDLAQAIDLHLCHSDGIVSLADIQALATK